MAPPSEATERIWHRRARKDAASASNAQAAGFTFWFTWKKLSGS